MRLATLLKDLSLGHLSDLPAAGVGDGTIEPQFQPKVLVRVGDALRTLYTRFPLQMKTLVVEAVDGVYQYPLRCEYAQTSASGQVNKFIKDTVAEPFIEDVLGIEHVYNSEHEELPLNVRGDAMSLYTPGFDILQIDRPVGGERFHVEYRAAHAPIEPNVDVEVFEVRVPLAAHSALKLLIAQLVHEGAGNEGSLTKASQFKALYDEECGRLELANTFNQSIVDTNTSFERGGWV